MTDCRILGYGVLERIQPPFCLEKACLLTIWQGEIGETSCNGTQASMWWFRYPTAPAGGFGIQQICIRLVTKAKVRYLMGACTVLSGSLRLKHSRRCMERKPVSQLAVQGPVYF